MGTLDAAWRFPARMELTHWLGRQTVRLCALKWNVSGLGVLSIGVGAELLGRGDREGLSHPCVKMWRKCVVVGGRAYPVRKTANTKALRQEEDSI